MIDLYGIYLLIISKLKLFLCVPIIRNIIYICIYTVKALYIHSLMHVIFFLSLIYNTNIELIEWDALTGLKDLKRM